MKDTIKRILSKISSYFPSKLPVGRTSFESWSEEVIGLAEAPNNDSVKFTLARMLMDTKPSAFYTKHQFVILLNKAMANEVAAAIFTEAKLRRDAEIKAQAEAAKAAAALEVPNVNQK